MRIPLSIAVLSLLVSTSCKGRQEQAKDAPPASGGIQTVPAPAPTATAGSTDVQDNGAPKAQIASADAGDSLFFALDRTPCFGRCPTYKVRIYEGGSATYEGIRSVEREGRFTGRVDRALMDALYARATAIGFFDMQDRYDAQVTDLPSTIIRVKANGQDKQVVGRVGTPPAFKAFATYADSLLNTVDWVKVEGEK